MFVFPEDKRGREKGGKLPAKWVKHGMSTAGSSETDSARALFSSSGKEAEEDSGH